MLRTYNIHEAKAQLCTLLEQVERGDDVVIARAGVPVARLVPVAPAAPRRVLGTETGRLTIPDDFDSPLPDDVIGSVGR